MCAVSTIFASYRIQPPTLIQQVWADGSDSLWDTLMQEFSKWGSGPTWEVVTSFQGGHEKVGTVILEFGTGRFHFGKGRPGCNVYFPESNSH